MASVNREAIETFMSITGAPEAVATRRLEEYGGNLNEAINAHFSEGDRNNVQDAPASVAAPPNDFMDADIPPPMEHRSASSLLSATRGLNPFSLLDPNFRESQFDSRSLFNTSAEQMGRAPFVSQPREVREIPIEVKDGHDKPGGCSSHAPRIEDVTDSEHAEGSEIRGTVIIDDEDGDTVPGNVQRNRISEINSRPSAPHLGDTPDYIEEEMIRAAIEASKRDAELHNKQDFHNVGPQERPSQHDDTDFAHVVSLSLKTAEQERLQREQGLKAGASGSRTDKTVEMEKLGKVEESSQRQGVGPFDNAASSQHTDKAGNSQIQDELEELDEQPLVRHRSRSRSTGSEEIQREVGEGEADAALTPPQAAVVSQAHPNGNAFPSDEWGGISSEEHDEAVMLEAAMFGGIPESGYHLPYAPHQFTHSGFDATWRAPRPPSPGLVAQRAIREQQDDEYFASLQADREKELKAMEEEKVAREAAVQEERLKREESQRKLEEEQELVRQLAAKEVSLPEEPPLDDENAVNLLVRMPDGSRRGRRFLKSDKLQSLFDFIDIGRGVKPGTYRVVRPYPRRAFSDGESNLTLNELGLTSKQEALFLELI